MLGGKPTLLYDPGPSLRPARAEGLGGLPFPWGLRRQGAAL
jgi:hypothetical protein